MTAQSNARGSSGQNNPMRAPGALHVGQPIESIGDSVSFSPLFENSENLSRWNRLRPRGFFRCRKPKRGIRFQARGSPIEILVCGQPGPRGFLARLCWKRLNFRAMTEVGAAGIVQRTSTRNQS